jgi:hypothetical protein
MIHRLLNDILKSIHLKSTRPVKKITRAKQVKLNEAEGFFACFGQKNNMFFIYYAKQYYLITEAGRGLMLYRVGVHLYV